LVFVYAVTQTVSLAHEELSWAGVAHAVILFWLVWWAWTQFTWALNSTDTTHPGVEAVMLVATAIAFLMAVTVPDAFGDAGGWFAATLIAVRVVGLALYGRVAWDDVAKRAAVRRFALLSAGGLAAVAGGGVVGGDVPGWWSAAAVLLDVVVAVAAGAAEGWDVRADHFSERHGLFVIIALGESLIVAGAGLTGAHRTTQTVAVGILAVAVTCGLWWSYFVTAKPLLDDAIRRRDQADRTTWPETCTASCTLLSSLGSCCWRWRSRRRSRIRTRRCWQEERRPGLERCPVRGRHRGRAPPQRQRAVGQTVGGPCRRRRRCLAHARRTGHLVAAGGGPWTPPAGRGGASDRESVEASLSAAPSPARSAE